MTERKPRILIIDDDVLVRETVKIALIQADFEAATLEEPSGAEEEIRRSKPDLILLDIYMPDLDGLDLCRRLKADPATARIPVVILTGSRETIDVISGIQAGAFEYLAKPVDSELLIQKIRTVLKIESPRGKA